MLTIEPVIDPDEPDKVLCYLVIDEYDIPRGHYDTYDDARDAIRTLQGDQIALEPKPAGATYYPN